MTLELLGNNLEKEKEIVKTLFAINERLKSASIDEARMLTKSQESLISQLKILNNSVPELLKNISFYSAINKENNKSKAIVSINYMENNQKKTLAIPKKDKEAFVSSLASAKNYSSISSSARFVNPYFIFCNKIFGSFSANLVRKQYFRALQDDLKKITYPYLLNTYISFFLMTTIFSFIAGLIIALVLFFLGFLVLAPLVLFFLPILVFSMLYFYPSAQRKTLEKGINQELPFLTIYLSAISTSGIEPSKIFSILAASKDYPLTQREIKKLINYINFYGYDLVGALKLLSKSSPSERLSLLFDGMATTITSGGELTSFLNKHSETLLFDYRLEREKYTKTAETFMDIYISIVIAAPMILMMLFVLMSITDIGGGIMSAGNLTFLTILLIGGLNMAFLLFLNLKQPKF